MAAVSFEQPAYSFNNNGRPPTPNQTPTSDSFDETLFHTPKVESSFFDPRVTWNTADPSASPTFPKTPRPLFSFTPNKRSFAALEETLVRTQDSHVEAPSNAQHLLATPVFPLLSPQLESPLPQVITAKATTAGVTLQTPPPTSGSASRRKPKRAQGPKPVRRSSTSRARHMSTPLLPKPAITEALIAAAPVEAAPQPPPALDFSPEVLGYTFATPATAPVYPQQKLFWDNSGSNGIGLDFHTDDVFGTPRQSALEPFVSSHHNVQRPQPATILDFSGPNHIPSFGPTNFVSSADSQHANVHSGHGVDPTLLFSSPGGGLKHPLLFSRHFEEDPLQPYAYQVQEARRERAYSGIVKPQKRRKPNVDSPAVKAALESLRDGDATRRPPIRRSTTDSAMSRGSRGPGTTTPSSKTASTHSRSSPSKHIRNTKSRTSLALTIDANGRARTETRTLVEPVGPTSNDSHVDLDGASESGSECLSDDGNEAIVTSFSGDYGMPKMGHFRTNSHSRKSMRESLYGSVGYSEGQPPLPAMKNAGPLRSTQTKATPRWAIPSLGTVREGDSFEDEQASEAETVYDADDIDGDGSAQHALKKIMRGRASTEPRPRPTSSAKNKEKSKHRLFSAQGFIPGHGKAFSSTLPTTITDPGVVRPRSAASAPLVAVRCVCSVASNKGQMVQCGSCKYYLHLSCTVFDSKPIPVLYLCLFCTGQGPTTRDDRGKAHANKSRSATLPPAGQKNGASGSARHYRRPATAQ